MSTKTIGGLTAISAGDFDDTALIAVRNNDSVDRKATIAQLRTQINTGNQTFLGNLLFTDATYDIGASGATRPRDLFLSRNAVVGGTLDSGVITSGTTAATSGQIRLPNNTSVVWRNAANNGNIGLAVNASDVFAFGAGISCTTLTATGQLKTTVTMQQLALHYDTDNHLAVTVASDGATTYNATGSGAKHLFSDTVELDGALDHDGSTAGFFGTAPTTKPTVTGDASGGGDWTSLVEALANLGLVTDSTT